MEKFIEINRKNVPNIIEIHNRPSYVKSIAENLKSKIILYFHNNPLTLLGSKSRLDRLNLLDKCDFIFFNSKWTKNQFFNDISETNYEKKFGICYQSTKKTRININKKKNIISFVGKLNTAKGYDIFGEAIIKILNEYPNWSSIVVGDELRENILLNIKTLEYLVLKKIHMF